MGTPDFALASLRALYESGEEIVGVVTQPDEPRGRGYVLTPPPVKVYATEKGIPVYQPATLRGGAFDGEIAALAPELIVVVAYGKLLPKSVLDAPPLGCINVHGSLLPALRGAAPMQRAIMEGLSVTGVTTMYLAHDMDAGDIIYTAETEIGEFETSGELFDRLMAMGAELLDKTLRAVGNGTAPRIPQNHA